MSRRHQTYRQTLIGFPRVSGDEPTVYTSGIKKTAFSPRERG